MKVVVVLEYDVSEKEMAAFSPNLALEDERGLRPGQMHIAVQEPALKILSVIEADRQ